MILFVISDLDIRIYMDTLFFNPNKSYVMHIDVNSCFATVEQQANPFLRNKPIVVAAYNSPGGCVLAASVDAKKLGIKTGMRVKEAKLLCPTVLVLTPDPDKYRFVHLGIRKIIADYTNDFQPKSIDEFVLNLEGLPCLANSTMKEVGQEIKNRIRQEVGDYITVSVGIAPNRFLAKTASNLKKPDGLEEININNYLEVYSRLKLTDLTGIASHNEARLNRMGIFSVLDLYNSSIWKIKAAFHSITGYYWYLRLRGIEIDSVETTRKTFGNSVALGKNISKIEELSPILIRLTEKMSERLRSAGYLTRGIHLAIEYKDGSFWHKGLALTKEVFDTRDIYKEVFNLLSLSPSGKQGSEPVFVRNLAVSLFNLTRFGTLQLAMFEDLEKKQRLVEAIDSANNKWGDFTLASALSFKGENVVLDRIAFGGVREL